MVESGAQNKRERIAAMEDMKGKVALVTGAAQGIGLACAEAFARAGAVAVLADINRPEEQARTLAESGLKAEAFACDVSDAGKWKKWSNG